ncbi:hypothetical protein [Treponema sp.]|uniref:hypothetical protein n=1 Tax=Treponema sp. TaxID=166 RepID=UPI00298E36A5|nr:hypothetical protein [Treponema sp.]MCQ2242477.1 hypothetical protein [Treponema sp.]
MARTKKEVSTAAFDAVEEKAVETAAETSTAETTEVNASEDKADEVMGNSETTEVNASEDKAESQPKTENHFYDDETVKIKSVKRAGKAITANTRKTIQFDSDGIAEVTGLEAKYLLTVPGFELA